MQTGARPSREKPSIRLAPGDLWRWKKEPVAWLRETRDALVHSAERLARRAVAARLPVPEEVDDFSKGLPPDSWSALLPEEREKLYQALFEQVVEASGATAAFVEQLLPQPLHFYVEQEVQRRQEARGEAPVPLATEAPSQRSDRQRQRIQQEAQRLLDAFLKKIAFSKWQNLPASKREALLAQLLGKLASRLDMSLPEVTQGLGAPLDVLLHQQARAMRQPESGGTP